jgi:hypothetical protein
VGDPLFWHRLQLGFTATYHCLFPQLTMGLALIIVALKALGLRTGEARYHDAARFWTRIFGINFAVGVVTGIPLEFQFGTNWARFSQLSGIRLCVALRPVGAAPARFIDRERCPGRRERGLAGADGRVSWQLGRAALVDPLTITLAALSTVALFGSRVNSIWVVVAGGVVGWFWTVAFRA